MKKFTINKEQRLFVIPSNYGYSCLGFEVCQTRANKLAIELGVEPWNGSLNNKRHLDRLYRHYLKLVELARQRHTKTGWRSQSELTPELIGLEGKRIKATDCWGKTVRFIVGKSTGFIPCHLEIKQRRSTGGGAVCGSPFKQIEVVK